jgi:hypothetical protein
VPPAFFPLVVLDIQSPLLPRPAWTAILFYAANRHWDDRHTSLHPAFVLCMGSHKLFA